MGYGAGGIGYRFRLPTAMSLLATLLAASLSFASPQGHDLANGECRIRVNDAGVLVAVPPAGLRSVDAHEARLLPGAGDWFAVAFVDGRGAHAACASGLVPDWAGRTPLQPVPLTTSSAFAVHTRTRIGALDVDTHYRFDPDGPRLLVTFELWNRGLDTLHQVFCTREWQVRAGEGRSVPDDWSMHLGAAPNDITRRIWMFDDLAPGRSASATFALAWRDEPAAAGDGPGGNVPLVWWTHPSFPTGLDFGTANGVSWGDYDRDGWIDVFCLQSGRLWRNLGGVNWQLVASFVPQLLASTQYRYGSSFGDYDNDGLPDLATEPRGCCGGDTCFHLLHNLGGGPNFAEVSTPAGTIITEPCGLDAETACWGDVDDDGDLDLFLPVYPPWVGSSGNYFWTNLGPSGPGGAYRFAETSASSGLDNPPGSARPEGAQICDVDCDGDLDLYSNGTLYQNKTAAGIDFDPMTEAASGIGLSTSLDEGAVLFDYDMDGDFDLFVVYSGPGVRIWENRGDGTYFAAETSIVASPLTGLDLGMSAEDWDNDGDIDFTTRQVFRRNMLVETGTRQFTVAPHAIPPAHLTSATPAWGDWDHDGDLDCALGNWLEKARLYANVKYGPTTPLAARRYVRVKPLRDSAQVPAGLETEFGVKVEIRIAGETSVRRTKFTASGHGYLNQNEYTLHFALPADPAPADPNVDLRFDVVVDFPTRAVDGLHRVDKHVNPVLGAIDFASLTQREIHVFRSGKVRINGCEVMPYPLEAPRLYTTAGGLRLPGAALAMPAPSAAPTPDRFVGLDFDTAAAPGFVRVGEVIVDGVLAAAVPGPAGPFQIALWDVTDPEAPVLVPGATAAAPVAPRNRRSYVPVNWLLAPGRHWRVVARVTQLRATAFVGPLFQGALRSNGGLDFEDAAPTTGAAVAAAAVDAAQLWVAIRTRDARVDEWLDLGGAMPGSNGLTPTMVGSGALLPGSTLHLDVRRALPGASVFFFASTSLDCQPLLGGTLLPDDPIVAPLATASAVGAASLAFTLPSSVAVGATLAMQAWLLDPGSPTGASATNAVWVVSR